ncbi:unnamed protein product, partial [Didymodactylos carnosus]
WYEENIDENYIDNGSSYTVYRGQRITKAEIDQLDSNKLVTFNTFLSATFSKAMALEFVADAKSSINQDIQIVLFVIHFTINHKLPLKVKPYIIIQSGEDECLFTVGSLFEVVEKTYSTNVWIISLTLVNEDDKGNDIARDYQTLKSTASVEAKLVRVGDLLLDDEKSETYYSIIKQEFGLMAGAHDSGMGWLKYRQKKFEEALEYQLKAVNRYKNDEDHKDVLVMSYCCIGAIHRQKEDNKAALEYYTKASDVGHSIIPVD